MPPREVSFRAFSSAYEYSGSQYPHQSSNGRRELRAMDRDQAGQPHSHTRASSSRDRSKVNSTDTAIHVPSGQAGEAMSEYQSEDFQKRYNAQRNNAHTSGTSSRPRSLQRADSDGPPTSPNFSEFDDGSGQPPSGTDLPNRGVHIPQRTR